MMLKIGELELPLCDKRAAVILMNGELRNVIALEADPSGVSMDALWDELTPVACAAAEVDGEQIGKYCVLVSMTRDAVKGKLIIQLAEPSEVEELRAAMAILTGEAE